MLGMLVSIVMLRSDDIRSDDMRAEQTHGAPAFATPHAAPLNARRVADAAGMQRLRAAWTNGTAATAPGPQTDPLAPVYIVTSRDTYQGIRGLVRDPIARTDSTGMPLVISRIGADRLGEIGRYVHVS
ncbi:MAG: hypothetical protein ABWX88_10300, partial [Pseudoxanthomonas sp.]